MNLLPQKCAEKIVIDVGRLLTDGKEAWIDDKEDEAEWLVRLEKNCSLLAVRTWLNH